MSDTDPIPISSATDYEQMEGSAGDKGETDNVDQEISARNDDSVITTRDEEINNYEVSARDVSYAGKYVKTFLKWHIHAEVHSGK